MNKIVSLFVFVWLGLQIASAQGLQDTKLSPDEIAGRNPVPKLLPGKTDQERWDLVSKNASKLIGMKQSQLTALFGNGVLTRTNEIAYQITKPQKSGKLAFIELRIKLISGSVSEYSVIGIWH